MNAGSSSIKFKLFNATNYQVEASGLCERIFVDGHFSMKFADQKISFDVPMQNHTQATEIILTELTKNKLVTDINEIIGVGHRVVLAGEKYSTSMIITPEVKTAIKDHIKLAPLHNEPELTVIEIFEKKLPNAVNVASFDNTYHSTIPKENYTYAIDQTVAKKYAIRRYGFHGNSYRFIALKTAEILKNPKPNLVVCHLGNGASICAIKEGKSYNTSMGLTPLEGIIMGTRSGDIDPSIPIYLMREKMDAKQIDNMLNKSSGLYGLVGSSDMRDILNLYDKKDEKALLAVKMYAKKIAEYIIRYINDLNNKVDAIVFTAGVGENSGFIIEKVCEEVKIIELITNRNRLDEKYAEWKIVSEPNSVFPIYSIRTDEELMIAQDVNQAIK
ncbi:MAG: acetate/propionate family kinase [Mycoplasmataceae bacterium]|nr:acetate/propionate family kinase [Mycoplasmataceae bacterium]